MASTRIDLSDALWFKSSYSNESGGDCVEVAANLPGPTLILTASAWTPFITTLQKV